jgi:hypothetical protein
MMGIASLHPSYVSNHVYGIVCVGANLLRPVLRWGGSQDVEEGAMNRAPTCWAVSTYVLKSAFLLQLPDKPIIDQFFGFELANFFVGQSQ